MPFEAFEVALEMVRSVRVVVEVVAVHDASLASQVRRAAQSVPLNLNEGRRRAGKDRLHHWRVAAGSADEVVAGLRVAEASGYVESRTIEDALTFCDRILAMTWRMTR